MRQGRRLCEANRLRKQMQEESQERVKRESLLLLWDRCVKWYHFFGDHSTSLATKLGWTNLCEQGGCTGRERDGSGANFQVNSNVKPLQASCSLGDSSVRRQFGPAVCVARHESHGESRKQKPVFFGTCHSQSNSWERNRWFIFLGQSALLSPATPRLPLRYSSCLVKL